MGAKTSARGAGVLLLLLISLTLGPVPRAAGQDQLYADVGGSNCVWPPPNGTFTVAFFLRYSYCARSGILDDITLNFERTFSGFKLSQTSFLGGPDYGDVEVDGWTLTTGGECLEPDQYDAIYIAEVFYLYLGQPGYILYTGHPVEGNVLTNCDGQTCEWYEGYVGVGMEAPWPFGCNDVPAVEPASWGSIKALYW